MGRSPCCDGDAGVKKGPWTPEEDKLLVDYIKDNGLGSWRRLPNLAGLNRCGKSCRLRWTNYLRPDIKRGRFTEDEDKLIINLHSMLGNKWSSIATKLPGRTDNEIKNYWNTHLRKKLLGRGIDPITHRPRTDIGLLAGLSGLLAASNLGGHSAAWDINALRLQADAAKFQLLQSLLQALATAAVPAAPTPGMDIMALLAAAGGGGLGVGQQHGVGAVLDHSMLLQQDDGLLNLPALTSAPSGMTSHLGAGLLNGFGRGSGALSGDGLSSTELGHGAASGNNMTAATVAPPSTHVPADQECNAGGNGIHGCGGGMSCEQTPTSSPFDDLDDINDDLWEMLQKIPLFMNPQDIEEGI